LGLANALNKGAHRTHRDMPPVHAETCGFGVFNNLEQFVAGDDTLLY
jgi:hypothetical protein